MGRQTVITLVHADARNYLPRLAAASFDVVASDPPYGVPMWSGGTHGYHLKDRDQEAGHALVTWAVQQAARLLRPDGFLYLMLGSRMFPAAASAAQSSGFKVKPWVWIKKNATPAFPRHPWRSHVELGLFGYRKLPSQLYGGGHSNYFIHPAPAGRRRVHPTQKPVALFETWFRQTPGRVLDPFMGVGTSMIAARRCGCSGVGIEIDHEWFRIAKNRMRTDRQEHYT
jgi:DNA modification methylase